MYDNLKREYITMIVGRYNVIQRASNSCGREVWTVEATRPGSYSTKHSFTFPTDDYVKASLDGSPNGLDVMEIYKKFTQIKGVLDTIS